MRWGIIGWILTLRRWLLYGNPSRPQWRLLLFTKLEQARYVLWEPGTVSPIRRESSVFVTAASDAVSLPRHNLQWPWRQWEVTRRLCGWSRGNQEDPILETKAQPNTSPVALLAAMLTYCFNGHSSPVCPIFFLHSMETYEHCCRADVILLVARLCPVWPAWQTFILCILTSGFTSLGKTICSPQGNSDLLPYTCPEKLSKFSQSRWSHMTDLYSFILYL